MQKPDISKLKDFFFRYRKKIAVSALAVFAVLLVVCLTAVLTVPGHVRKKLDDIAMQQLNRHLSIGHIRFNPLNFGVTLSDINLYERDSDRIFVSIDSLYFRASLFSVFTSVPVVHALSVENPTLHIARTGDYEYSFSDLLDRARQPGERAEYSINNIEISGGKIHFEDVPARAKHLVEDIHIRIPSIATGSAKKMGTIEPHLTAVVNGHRLDLSGKSHPFDDDMDSVFSLALDDIEMEQYVGYLPFRPDFSLDKGRLSFDLNVHYVRDHAASSEFEVSGRVLIHALRITDLAKKPMIAVAKLDAQLQRSAVFAHNFHVAKLHLTRPQVYAVYDADGFLSLMKLLPRQHAPQVKPASPALTEKEKSPGRYTKFAVKDLEVHDAGLDYANYAEFVPYSVAARNMNLTVKEMEFNTGSRIIRAGSFTSDKASLEVALEKASSATRQTVSAAKDPAAYTLDIGKIDVRDWSAHLENKNIRKPYGARLSGFSAHIENVSTVPGNVSPLRIATQIDRRGRISVEGKAGLYPLQADLDVDLADVGIVALQQYIDEYVNLALRGADVTARGNLSVATGSGGALRGTWTGDVRIANLSTTDLIRNDPFVYWRDLALREVNAQFFPFSASVASAQLGGFYARLILGSEGRLNLMNILRSEAGGEISLTDSDAYDEVSSSGQTESAPADSARTETKERDLQSKALPQSESESGQEKTVGDGSSPEAALSDASEEGDRPLIRINRLQLGDGRIRFTDNFIEPNYTADIDQVQGEITGISSEAGVLADIDLKGQVNRAPMTFVGAASILNPVQSLELRGQVKGMELAQLSAYSTKYIGYGIERGKLSFDVRYAIKEGRLHAQNRLVLDQLTFSEKRDVEPVINMPVLFAVRLLQDANGVMEINLPVSGSLHDPQFSLGGIVMQMVLGMITRAIASPFSFLGSFGTVQELSRIDFVPGHSDITAQAEEALLALSEALNARPALKLDIAGCYDVELDREGVARAAISRKVRELKRKKARQADDDVPQAEAVLSEEEYASLLNELYSSASFKKPHNGAGSARVFPVAEMEKQMIGNYVVTEEELKAVANSRADNVKAWFLDKGDIADERLFISASKSMTGENSTRVDFTLH